MTSDGVFLGTQPVIKKPAMITAMKPDLIIILLTPELSPPHSLSEQ
ncbi:hypothetical protein CSC17_0246 [Klebsiella oxytoca]|nr:hypothetical protein CSC17_0246 [Klebsiella oxytoca]